MITGLASNLGLVAGVDLRILDNHEELYWDDTNNDWISPEDTWIRIDPGSIEESFAWIYQWDEINSGSGQYRLTVKGFNAAGQESLQPWAEVDFFGPVDNVMPSIVIALPTQNQVLNQISQIPNGTGVDLHSGIVRVAVEIRDTGNGDLFWLAQTI